MNETFEETIKGFGALGGGLDWVSRIRKNHAMEHATIHVLSAKHPRVSFGGYSIHKGFWIYGKTDLQVIQDAVEIAQARLLHGEKKLAVHPNCGTNLAMTGLICAGGSLLAMAGADNRKERLSRASYLILAGVLGAYYGKPLGMKVQKNLTTDPNVGDLRVVGIRNNSAFNGTPAFFVETDFES